MSLPVAALNEDDVAKIVAFYDEVFGWKEIPTLTEDRSAPRPQAYSYDQFVFLIAEDDP